MIDPLIPTSYLHDMSTRDAAIVGKAKVFKHGGSQAVRLPKAFRVEADEVTVKRVPGGILLSTTEDRLADFDAMLAELARLRALAGPFQRPERPPDDERLSDPWRRR